MGLLRKGMESSARVKEIVELSGAIKAAELALASIQPGELVLVQADAIDETMQWLRGYLASRAPAEPVVEPAEEAAPIAEEAAASSETLSPAEIGHAMLAETQVAVKV